MAQYQRSMWFPPSSPHPHPAPQLPIGCHNQAASCTHASDVCQCLMKLYGFPFCSNCMHLVESICKHLGYQMSLKSKLLSRALCTAFQFRWRQVVMPIGFHFMCNNAMSNITHMSELLCPHSRHSNHIHFSLSTL